MPRLANRPDLVVTTTAVSAGEANRRLTTAAIFRASTGIGVAGDDTEIEKAIDRVSELLVRECGLVETAGGERPTFRNERLTATWYETGYCRGDVLNLPWRVPVTGLTSVVENGVTLTANTDFVQIDAKPGRLRRLSAGQPTLWSSSGIVVVFNAGWSAVTDVPPLVEAAVLEQVKAQWLARKRDPLLRSIAVPDFASASYSVGGGDSMGDAAILPQVLSAMVPYWNPAR